MSPDLNLFVSLFFSLFTIANRFPFSLFLFVLTQNRDDSDLIKRRIVFTFFPGVRVKGALIGFV